MIPNVQLHWMHMPIINSIPIVNSPLIAPETTVDVLRNPPLITLTEDHKMRVAVDPIHRDDGLRAFVDPVSSEAWNLFREGGKEVSERGGLVSDCDVVEVPVDIIGNGVLVILNDVSSLLNRVYKHQIAREGRVDGGWCGFRADFGPMVGSLDNLFGVKSEEGVGSDGENELEGFVGVRRVDEEGRFGGRECGNKK